MNRHMKQAQNRGRGGQTCACQRGREGLSAGFVGADCYTGWINKVLLNRKLYLVS